ncbi:MAG: hypothetical protein ACLFQJ_00500 [Campylobacterales bacterium]
MRRLFTSLVIVLASALTLSASGFGEFYERFGDLDVNKGYSPTNGEIKAKTKKLGYYASVDEVRDALNGVKKDGKPIVIVDSRTKAEQEGLYLKGAILANLRGWNKAFEKPSMHSNNLGGVYSYCRTGTDQADNIVKLQWLFQGKAKVFGIKDMVDACHPAVSKSGNVLDASLWAKKTYVQSDGKGEYYEVNCPQVKDACTPIAVYTQDDIEVTEDLGDELPKSIVMKNKNLNKEVTVYKGADNHYYKKHCWGSIAGK